jgi:Asp-tRNA(Asn)/Glu-tRNA(Gln) amidotransferase A subunit family amidase
MDASRLNWLPATDAARLIREGAVSAEQLAEACLARVREVDDQVQAWAFLDPEHVLKQARACDAAHREGRASGPLHGVPIGIKDIFDTEDMPTEDGTVLHAGRTPARDATVVAMLRAAGGVIMGKTVTTELATYTPASLCGVYGFKPTFGLIPRTGALKLSRTLDQVGVFGRALEDVALAAQELVGYDSLDPDTRPRARVAFAAAATEEPPLPPTLAYIRGPVWDRADGETREAFAELAATLDDRLVEIDLPDSARQALDWHQTIMGAEMAANLDREWEKGRERLSSSLQAQLDRGRKVNALDYLRACARIPSLNEGFEDIFERCDVIVTPATPGTAPAGLDFTGDPSFCTLWTLCGMPALCLPLMQGGNGLPLGVQLVGRRGDDARLLRTARWLVDRVEAG